LKRIKEARYYQRFSYGDYLKGRKIRAINYGAEPIGEYIGLIFIAVN